LRERGRDRRWSALPERFRGSLTDLIDPRADELAPIAPGTIACRVALLGYFCGAFEDDYDVAGPERAA